MFDRVEMYFQKAEVLGSLTVGSLMSIGASLQQIKGMDMSSELLGPLGALALSIVVLYIAIQAIKALVSRNDRLAKEHQRLYERMVEEKNKEIEELKRKLENKL